MINRAAAALFCALALLAAFGVAPAAAATVTDVTLTQTQLLTARGQTFSFDFGGLAPSDGAGGVVTIASGDARADLDPVDDGLDIDGAAEFFDLTIDGVSKGSFTCDPNAGAGFTTIANADVTMPGNCEFTLAIALDGAMLDALLSDNMVAVAIMFSNAVNGFSDDDEVIVSLAYTAIVTPLPAALPFFLAGLGGLAAIRRARRRASIADGA